MIVLLFNSLWISCSPGVILTAAFFVMAGSSSVENADPESLPSLCFPVD